MDNEVENQMMEFMKPLFGDMAQKTIDNQKAKLNMGGKLNREDYMKMADSIRDLCMKMAGKPVADKIYSGLMEIIEAN